jgi:hypothetical protein
MMKSLRSVSEIEALRVTDASPRYRSPGDTRVTGADRETFAAAVGPRPVAQAASTTTVGS